MQRLKAKYVELLKHAESRARHEMQQIQTSMEALNHVAFSTEFLQRSHPVRQPSDSQRIEQMSHLLAERKAAASSGSISSRDLHELQLHGDRQLQWDVATSSETEMWLISQIADQIRSGDTHEDFLRALDSSTRAAEGKFKFHLNHKAPQRTAIYKMVKTREALQEVLSRSYQSVPYDVLSGGHIKNRGTYWRQYCEFCAEGMNMAPVRISWLLDLSRAEHYKEETLMLAWMTYCNIRFMHFNTVEQAVSHVMQFHMTHLDIVPPPFPRLHNRLRLGRKLWAKKGAGRRRAKRLTLTPPQLAAMVQVCQRTIQSPVSQSSKIAISALWAIMTACFQLLFRVGELARGADFDPKIHWTPGWLAPLLSLADGDNECIPQPQRKVANEASEEFMPIVFQASNPSNFVYALKAKFQIHRPTADQDAFCIDAAGTPASAGWVFERTRALIGMLYPRLRDQFTVGDHIYRRGGATVLCFMKIDPAVQEHAGGFSRNSKCRPDYIAQVRETLADIQTRMHQQQYTVIQDEGMFQLRPSNPSMQDQAAAPEPVSPQDRPSPAQQRQAFQGFESVIQQEYDAVGDSDDDDEDDTWEALAKREDANNDYDTEDDSNIDRDRSTKTKTIRRKRIVKGPSSQDIRQFMKTDQAIQPEPALTPTQVQPASFHLPLTQVQIPTATRASQSTVRTMPPDRQDVASKSKQASKQASKQTSKQASKRASQQASKQASEQASKPKIQVSRSQPKWGHEDTMPLFDLSAAKGVVVATNATPVCLKWQFDFYHSFQDCEFGSNSHICSHCRRFGHSCTNCDLGGRERIALFKQMYPGQH